MKAVVVRTPGELALETVPDPTPEPGQMVLRVRACGICGSDLHLHQAAALGAGAVMGHEFCGEVMESAGGFRAGERVCALPVLSCGSCQRCRSGLGAFCSTGTPLGLGAQPGAFADYVAVVPHQAVRLPAGVDDALGALVEPLAVGLHAVNVARVRRGESCLVIGAGPIGLAIAMWARTFGAGEVVVSEGVAVRRDLAERIGATAVIDPATESLPEAVARQFPEGPDVVFEAVGLPGLIQRAIDVVRFRGRVVVAGACLGPDTIQPIPTMIKEASLHFVLAYEKDDFQYAVDMLDDGRISPGVMITDRIGLEDVPGAFKALENPEGHCKVIAFPSMGLGDDG
jgi:(R,R)-butanediol dehydrogenase/meso-butanediol dehydrogenase/diacetyl reductase